MKVGSARLEKGGSKGTAGVVFGQSGEEIGSIIVSFTILVVAMDVRLMTGSLLLRRFNV